MHETKNNSYENSEKDNNSSNKITSVNPQSSLLSLIDRKHWGVLGELRNNSGDYVESHQLSLYHESIPWKQYLIFPVVGTCGPRHKSIKSPCE